MSDDIKAAEDSYPIPGFLRKPKNVAAERREPEHGQKGPVCECGGCKSWCAQCRVWSKTCCVEYGTCQCS